MITLNSILIDSKVKGLNISATTTIGYYWEIMKDIYESNEYQRRRERTKWNVYKLLKEDILEGCLMPSITLATSEEFLDLDKKLTNNLIKIIDSEKPSEIAFLEKAVNMAIKNEQILILDGLQRTYTIKSAIEDASGENLEYILNRPIRIEIYVGLTKYGLLYRMLTLNTGQTPMSLRHQLEILFSDYIDKKKLKGITLYTESKQASYKPQVDHYKFSDVIEMYQSFILKSPQSFNRKMLLEDIKKLEFLESYKREKDPIMKSLIISYNNLIRKISDVASDWKYKGSVPKPFGKTIPDFFIKPQAMSGYGYACNMMMFEKKFNNLAEIEESFSTSFNPKKSSLEDGLQKLVDFIAEIQEKSRRYGTDQRQFLATFFEFLLRDGMDTDDFSRIVVDAYDRY